MIKIDLKGFDKRTRKYMTDVLEKLNGVGAVEECDKGALCMLRDNYELFVQTMDVLRAEGTVLKDKHGKITINPANKLLGKYSEQVVKYQREFGLTPKSREKIRAMVPSVDEDNPFMEFMRNGDMG